MAIKYTKKIIEEAVNNSKNRSDVLCFLGLKPDGGHHKHIKKLIYKYNISTSHFIGVKIRKTGTYVNKETFLKNYLIQNKELHGQWVLKKLCEFQLKENKCEECGIVEWNNKPIVKDLHHINKKHDDNRLENLQILCPNCHSQKHRLLKKKRKIIVQKTVCKECKRVFTIANKRNKTICYDCYDKYAKFPKPIIEKHCKYCGKLFKGVSNKIVYCSPKCSQQSLYKIIWPPKEELEKLVWEKSTVILAQELGVSDSAICKKCKKWGIEKPPRGYWNKQKAKKIPVYPENKPNGIQWPTKEELEKLVWEKSLTKIAKDLNITKASVRYRCIKYNIETPPAGYWNKGKHENIIWPTDEELELLLKNSSIKIVAENLNVATCTLERRCKKHNIKVS